MRAWSRRLSLPPEPLGEKRERLLEPLFEVHLRRPSEQALRLLDAHGGALLLARTRGREMHRHVGTGAALQCLGELDDGCLDTGTDVETASIEASRRGEVLRRRSEVRTSHVLHEHVIAGLRAVAEHGQRLAAQDAVAEDRDDARLAVRVLPRAIHVGVPQGYGVDTM